jgi:hypothetical protein
MQTGNLCLRDALSLSAGVAIGAAVAFAAARRTTTVAHRVHQTILEPPHGNALQACAASILGLPLNLVPNFVVEVDHWDAMLRFAALRGLTLIKVNLDGGLLPHKTLSRGTVEEARQVSSSLSSAHSAALAHLNVTRDEMASTVAACGRARYA